MSLLLPPRHEVSAMLATSVGTRWRSGFTTLPSTARLERLANRELEVFNVVSIIQQRVMVIFERNRVTEFEQAEWRKPLNCKSSRRHKILRREGIVHGVVALVSEEHVAFVGNLAEVVEQGGARGG